MRSVSWPDHLAALRRRLAAHPLVRWIGVLALAATAATSVADRQQAATDARAAWATSRPVLVAVADIPAGGELTAASTELRSLPPAAVPPSALAERPVGGVATRAIVAGEVVLAGAVSLTRGPTALLPPGSTGVAVPLPIGWRPNPGDEVSVYGLGEVGVGIGGDTDEAGARAAGMLTERATIVVVGDDGVLMAVPDLDAGPVAEAAARGSAVLLLRRPAAG